jgi:hypothetical protein
MRPPLVRLTPLLILLLSGACSRHPSYGRPTPRDTVPTTTEPAPYDPKAPQPRYPAPAED